MGLWRAGCGGTRTSGSEVRAGETDRPRGRHRAPVRPYSFAWLTKFRRLVRDYETLPATHEAMIWTAATWQLSNRLTR
jgi:hypothetical protein